MGCNSSTHTAAEDTAHSNSKSDSNGASTTGEWVISNLNADSLPNFCGFHCFSSYMTIPGQPSVLDKELIAGNLCG